MLRAFVVKHLESHPVIAELCGFDMRKDLPDESQFYRFLKTTNNSLLQEIYYRINKKLIEDDIISLDTFIRDSKPVMAATKDDNLKNPHRNTTNKYNKPQRNPAATLGYYSYQNIRGTKKNQLFYWGYRTHVIVSKQGIPLVELTLPNNQTDAKVAKKLIKKLKRVYGVKKNSIKLRTEVERYFARLGDREVEQTAHYDMRSIKNQMTIAHLSLSLIAYSAAVLMKQPDKTRYYRTFAHDYIPVKAAA